jgi:hypothetical protein
VVELVLGWREVGRQDVTRPAVYDKAGSYAANLTLHLGFHAEKFEGTVYRIELFNCLVES